VPINSSPISHKVKKWKKKLNNIYFIFNSFINLGQQQQSMDGDASRPVLTAARRTRVRVLYSQDHGKSGGGGFPMSMVVQGRRGQVAPMLGHSPPNMLVANKRGRHCSKSSNSPSRPSLNFDKMRKVSKS